MEAKMDRILANMATSEDLQDLTSKVEGRLKKVEKSQEDIKKNQKDMLGRIESLEKERTRSNTKANKTDQRLKRLTEESGSSSVKADSDAKAYEQARRQLILSPVSPDMEMVQLFLERQMNMDLEAVRGIQIVNLKKLFKRPTQKDKAGCQTIVTFGSVYERDLVISHASNLPEGCTVDLVIPDYLQSLKSYMDRFAYKVRKHAREAHQTKFSTSIRMDDIEQTLYLATRESGEEEWIYYSKHKLKDLDGALKHIYQKILDDTEMMEEAMANDNSQGPSSK